MPKQIVQISVRLDPEDYVLIRQAAEAAKESMNAWIVGRLREHYPSEDSRRDAGASDRG